MKKLIFIGVVSFTSFILTCCGQSPRKETKNYGFKALARLVSDEGGNKINVLKYVVIKSFSDSLRDGDTIHVAYAFDPIFNTMDTVLLRLNKGGSTINIKNYFHCPDLDGQVGIQKAKISFISSEYWEGCETGKGDCKPLTFTRTQGEKNWFLIMPCGGTETGINIYGNEYSNRLHLFSDKCPPTIEMTDMKDGLYSASMIASGLGGTVVFHLKTK